MLLAPSLFRMSLLLLVTVAALMGGLLATAAYRPVSHLIFEIMAEPEHNYGYLLLAVGGFVLWRRLPLLLRHHDGPSWLGTVAVALGAGVILLAGYAFVFRLSYGAFFLVLAGFLVAYFGRGSILLLLAPFAAFALAVPVPGYLTVQLSTKLQFVSSVLGAEILHLLDIAVFQDGNIIDLGVYQLQVAEACSGLRYLFPLVIVAILVIWLARAPWWGKLLTIAAVVPLTILLNSLRIAITGVLVNTRGIEAAQGFMHYFEGWVVFLVALAILAAVICTTTWIAYGVAHPSDILDFDRIEGTGLVHRLPPSGQPLPSPLAAPMAASFALLLASTLAQQALVERPPVIPERPPLAAFPLVVGDHVGTPQRIDPEIVGFLGSSEELLVDYAAPGRPATNLWVAYYASQRNGAAIHSPQHCLPGAGWEYEELRRVDRASPGAHRPFRVNEAIVVNGSRRIAMVYWVDARGRRFANELMNKIYNIYDMITIRRTDAALVRLITPVQTSESDEDAIARIHHFIDLIYPDLERFIGR